MLDWTEKYRPKGFDGIVGNSEAVNKLNNWAKTWVDGIPKKNKAVVLIGEPGIGKTTCAHALAHEYGWQVLELNASDARNAQAIESIAGLGARWETFTDEGEFKSSQDGGRKLIILDEADNLTGKEDRGGIRAIGQLILETKQPIILIVNDYYALKRKSTIVSTRTLQIKYRKPPPATIAKLLRSIAQKEHIDITPEALRAISKRCEGDIRGSVNDLQSLSEGKDKLTEKDVLALGGRDQKSSIFKGMAKVFRTNNCKVARDTLMELDEDPNFTILWMDENIPMSYSLDEDRMRAYDALSKSDVYLGRVHRRQYYGMWKYATDMMSAGVSLSKSRDYRGFVSYRFPSWLTNMSRSKGVRETRNSLGSKLGKMVHTSRSQALEEQLPYFKSLFNTNREFCLKTIEKLGLSESEVGFLMDQKPDSRQVRSVFDEISSKRIGAQKIKRPEVDEISDSDMGDKQPEPVKEEPAQKNLFDF